MITVKVHEHKRRGGLVLHITSEDKRCTHMVPMEEFGLMTEDRLNRLHAAIGECVCHLVIEELNEIIEMSNSDART